MMRSMDAHQAPSSRSHQHRQHQHQQQQQQNHHHNKVFPIEQTCSSSMGDNGTKRSSVRRSKHHHHHHQHQQHQHQQQQHHQQHDSIRSQRQSQSRRRHQSGTGDNEDNAKSQIDAGSIRDDFNPTFSVADNEDAQFGLIASSNGLAPHSSLIDQLLISSAKASHQQATSASVTLACGSNHRRRKAQQQHDNPGVQAVSVNTSSSRSASQGRDEPAEGILADSGSLSARAEVAAGKALAKQWDVSKQFVIANCINCLSQRMRDLQQTDDPVLANQKLTALKQLRRLTDSIRRVDLTKQMYSAGKRAKQSMAAVGLRREALSADLLQRWSSRENEYHMYWMALLEKSAAGLASCQDVSTLQKQLEFAQDLVDVQGLPFT